MNGELRVGDLTAARSKKVIGEQALSIAGDPYSLTVFAINGNADGPTLVVTGGIHGAEYASIEAALRLGRSLKPEKLRGKAIVVPVVNMPAFKARSIYICPLDGKNLNRVFPGRPNGTATEQLAHWLFQNVMKQADYYVDLHGGDMNEALVPFTIFFRTGNDQVDTASLEMARVFGIRYLVRSDVPGSTFSAASQAGIPAILTESGGQGIWREGHVEAHTRGLDRLMRHLGMLDGKKPKALPTRLMDQFVWLRSEHDGFYYPKVHVAGKVRKGQALGHVADFQGNVLQPIAAPIDGTVLFLVSSLAMNKGDPLLAIGA